MSFVMRQNIKPKLNVYVSSTYPYTLNALQSIYNILHVYHSRTMVYHQSIDDALTQNDINIGTAPIPKIQTITAKEVEIEVKITDVLQRVGLAMDAIDLFENRMKLLKDTRDNAIHQVADILAIYEPQLLKTTSDIHQMLIS